MWLWRLKKKAPPAPPAPNDRLHTALLDRVHQQAAVSALGQQALAGAEIPMLLEHATMFVTQTLAVEIACIQTLTDQPNTLRIAAASGLIASRAGEVVVAQPKSLERYVLDASAPVITRNLKSINQFEVPVFLRESGAISGISLVIQITTGSWGLLHAYTRRMRSFSEDDFHFLQSLGNVIGAAYERHRAEQETTKLAAFAQLNPNPVMELDENGNLTYFNEATRDLIISLNVQHPSELLPSNTLEIVQHCLETRTNLLDHHVKVSLRTIDWSFFPTPSIGRVHAYATDVTERSNLEAQLRQSQKMEAVGQLAAGVAHDFNNILTIMQGLIYKVSNRCADPESALEQLSDTTERAAALTRQLLAFSRRQLIQPQVINLGEIAEGISKMLQRLIGEDIVLTVSNPPDLPQIEADPSMMEQVLLNLAVNARDAMPRGGQLVISTDAVVFGDENGFEQRYVRLRVQDTGCGMNDEVKARIFEPFFTTKEVGKGTGLGLATVFGIVKQHDGTIEVETEVGLGTTFSIFLPVTDKIAHSRLQGQAPGDPDEPPAREAAEPPAEVPRPSETIMIVEDEPLLRELAQMVLTSAGYNVLDAGECDQAFEIWQQYHETIDLLLTDMVLPGGMTGRDLALELLRHKPSLKVIYTTGYSSDVLDAAIPQTNFLQKPYQPEALTRIVRACLDARPAVH